MRFTLLGQGAGFQVGHIGSLVVTTHTQAATAEMIGMLDALLEHQRSVYPRFSVLAMVTGTGIRSPAPGLRELVIAQERRFESSIIGAAVAIEAKGLPAVLTRTFLVAYTLVSSHAFELQSFGGIDAALAWLQKLPGQERYFSTDTECLGEARKLLARALAA